MRHLQTVLHSSLLQSVKKTETPGQSGFDCSVTAVRSYCLREYKESGSTRKTKKKSRGGLSVSCHSITCFLHYHFEYLSEKLEKGFVQTHSFYQSCQKGHKKHRFQLTTTCNSNYRASKTFFIPTHRNTCTQKQTHTYTHTLTKKHTRIHSTYTHMHIIF